jgi:hypothetical protein
MMRRGERRIAVEWLHPDHEFPRGAVPAEFIGKLKRLAACGGDSIEALGWGAAGGFHTCEFCEKSLASGTFGVPAGEEIFDAPEMIAHYVEQHSYLPPEEFMAAVLACPIPGTKAYAVAVKSFAIRG